MSLKANASAFPRFKARAISSHTRRARAPSCPQHCDRRSLGTATLSIDILSDPRLCLILPRLRPEPLAYSYDGARKTPFPIEGRRAQARPQSAA